MNADYKSDDIRDIDIVIDAKNSNEEQTDSMWILQNKYRIWFNDSLGDLMSPFLN